MSAQSKIMQLIFNGKVAIFFAEKWTKKVAIFFAEERKTPIFYEQHQTQTNALSKQGLNPCPPT
jgi:hypothetical protein